MISLTQPLARESETKICSTLQMICAMPSQLNTLIPQLQGFFIYQNLPIFHRRREVELLGKLRTFVE